MTTTADGADRDDPLEESIVAYLQAELGFDTAHLERLGVEAYNAHYRFHDATEDTDYHLVHYTLPEDLPLNGIKFEHAILRHLASVEFEKIPTLYVDEARGESLFRIDDTFFCITEFIDHCQPVPNDELSDTMIDDLAASLGELLVNLSTLDMTLDYFPEHIFVYPAAAFYDRFDALLDDLSTRAADTEKFDDIARAHIEQLLPMARQFVTDFDWERYGRLQQIDRTTIVHGDYRPMNIVFDPETGEVDKILDFNCSFNEIRLWDICYTALSLEGKETIGCADSYDRAVAFLRAFHRHHPLSAEERALLPHFFPFVPLKLMVAAVESWWINDRFEMFTWLCENSAVLVAEALGVQ